MRTLDPLFVALTRRETLGDGLLPYRLSILVTMVAVIAILLTRQWITVGVLYALSVLTMAVMQSRDEDLFVIVGIKVNLVLSALCVNARYWGARSYDP